MGCSLIEGLIATGHKAELLRGADPDAARRRQLAGRYGIPVFACSREAAAQTDVLLLAVKPGQMRELTAEIAQTVAEQKALVISIAAGIRLDLLRQWLGEDCPIVRAMPNMPAMVRTSATALCAGSGVSEHHCQRAEAVMRSIGSALWLEHESLMDAVTAISGSGPAYFFLLMELMERGAVQLGLGAAQAKLLVRQTAFGAAKLALQSAQGPAALRRQVSSPGGTTEAATQVLLEGSLEALWERALRAARDRSAELAEAAKQDS